MAAEQAWAAGAAARREAGAQAHLTSAFQRHWSPALSLREALVAAMVAATGGLETAEAW